MKIIERLAKATAEKYKPKVIAVAGPLGKTAIKQAIANILKSNGISVSVMGDGKNMVGDMSRAILARPVFSSFMRLLFGGQYPDAVILEFPPAGPADLKARLKIIKPDILVIAGMGSAPDIVQTFENETDIFKDILHLAHSVKTGGAIIYNIEEKKLSGPKDKIKSKLVSFGFAVEADFKISNFENNIEADGLSGTSFKIESSGSFIPVLINGVSGKFYAYASAASAAVASVFGINLVKISESLRTYGGEPGVGRILGGVKSVKIIDESRDSSLWGTALALDTLKELKAKRKIVILGDILGVGKYAEPAHKEIGKLMAKIADVIVTVGPRAKFIAEGAEVAGFSKKDIYSFDLADEETGKKVQDILTSGDLVLIKGSKFLKMESIVLEIMAEPERAEELLVQR